MDQEHRRADELREALLHAVQEFFDRHPGLDPAPLRPVVPERRVQLAAAVVFLSMVRADHEVRQDEHRVLSRVVERVLGVSSDEAVRVIRLAEEDASRLVPLHEFLRLIRDSFPYVQKMRTVEGLWRLAYADAELAGHEEYLVRKAAELLGLSTADLVEAKVRAREAFLDEDLKPDSDTP